ncbi:MAG: sugar kinase, partial [Pseudoflavonifractor sp.]
PVYRAAWDEYLDALALLIVSLRMVLDCDVVAGGAVGAYLSPYLPELRARVTALDPFRDSASCVTACRFQWEASAYGAAMQHVRGFLGEE